MRQLVSFIQEKLKIGSKSKVNNFKKYTDDEIDELLKKYSRNDVPQGLKTDIYYKTPGEEWRHREKMEGYYKKGSKPERLVASIKNREKMIKRWDIAMNMEWDDAAEVFKDEIIKRGYYTEDELFAYIVVFKVKSNPDKYKKYLW